MGGMTNLGPYEVACEKCGKVRSKYARKCVYCPTGVEFLYRYEDKLYDDYPIIRLLTLKVERETPYVWFVGKGWSERRVYKDSRKSFAYPTIELARNSFEIRKRKQLGYLARQHDHAAAIVARIEAGTAYEPFEIKDPFGSLLFEEPEAARIVI